MTENTAWPIEEIPPQDDLFYRVDIAGLMEDMQVHTGCFRENKGSISCDWSRYRSASETRGGTGKPEQFAVIRLNAGKIREVKDLELKHDPILSNQAHSSIFGLGPSGKIPAEQRAKREGLRVELYKRFKTWEIAPGAPTDSN